MKKLKLNILCVLALIMSLISCSQDEVNDNETLLEANTELTARRNFSDRQRERFCDVSFLGELSFTITLVNNNGVRRTLNVSNRRSVFFEGGLGSIFYTIPSQLRRTGFYRAGIKSYTIAARDGGVAARDIAGSGSINDAAAIQSEVVIRAGQRLRYTGNIRGRNRRNINNIQFTFNRNDRNKTCFDLLN